MADFGDFAFSDCDEEGSKCRRLGESCAFPILESVIGWRVGSGDLCGEKANDDIGPMGAVKVAGHHNGGPRFVGLRSGEESGHDIACSESRHDSSSSKNRAAARAEA